MTPKKNGSKKGEKKRAKNEKRSRIVTGGLIQMSNPINDPEASVEDVRDAMLEKHLPLIDEAGKRGVQILCLQEVFNGPYFCPSQD